MIANEFAEATGDLYVSSLILLGLVLFGLTIVINAVARILILTDAQGRGANAMMMRDLARAQGRQHRHAHR